MTSVLAELPLQIREEVTSLSEVLLLARRYIAVGTAIFPNDQDADNYTLSGTALSAKEGRLLLVEAVSDTKGEWSIRLAVNMTLGGAVYDSKAIHGFLAVAAGSKVSWRPGGYG
jgi:DNA damage-binding protein 1